MDYKEYDKLHMPVFFLGITLLMMVVYWFSYAIFDALGWTSGFVNMMLSRIAEKGFFTAPYKLKLAIVGIVVLDLIIRRGTRTTKTWAEIVLRLAVSLLIFFFPFMEPISFALMTIGGYIFFATSVTLFAKKLVGLSDNIDNDPYESFEQCQQRIDTKDSVNIPFRYKYRRRWKIGWINVVNPFRATIILGTPGSGKSFSVYTPFLKTFTQKGYMNFVYDFKFPTLTKEVYNYFLEEYKGKKNPPQFCILNFDDPRYSMRCNPMDPRYLTDPIDAHEIADIIMSNVDRSTLEKDDFFAKSAKVYIACLVWYLKRYKDGIYCTFPHLIELMGKSYKTVFKILQKPEYEDLNIMVQPFADALQGNAQEQLQGQIASARIPLLRFPSASLYWALSGDDFTLDFNNPDHPAFICMGNNPDRQAVYGTTLALYIARIFRVVNHPTNKKGKRNIKCGILLDELPTIVVNKLDNLIATARSNKVAIVLGAQDKSQLIRDYSEKEANIIFNTVGNIIAGQVNGATAKQSAEMFGKEFRERVSETISDTGTSMQSSFQLQEIMPQSKIETLSQGYFFGKVADDNSTQISKKLFYGEVQIDPKGRLRNDKAVKERIAREKKWEPIPAQGEHYFNDAEIEREVRENADAECTEYIYRQIVREDEAALRRDPHHLTYSEETGRQEAAHRYSEMTDEEKKEILDAIVKVRQDEDMHRVLNENYKKIKGDILEMFEYEGVSEFDEDGAAAESGTTSGGGAPATPATARPQGGGRKESKEKQLILTVTKGEEDNMRRVTDALRNAGLSSADEISQPGDYAVSAGTVEVFPHYAQYPCRIQFRDGIVYDIVAYDINTGELREALDTLEVYEDVPAGWNAGTGAKARGPKKEAAPAPEQGSAEADPDYMASDEDPTVSEPLDLESLMGDPEAKFDMNDF